MASRTIPVETVLIGKYLGDALYASLFYLLVRLGFPTWPLLRAAILAAILIFAVELFQLTGIPYQASQSASPLLKVAAFLLGTVFGWLDVVAYVVGIGAALACDLLVDRNRSTEQVGRDRGAAADKS